MTGALNDCASFLRCLGAAGVIVLSSSCRPKEDTAPILTEPVFFEAARECEAVDPVYMAHGTDVLPSFSFVEQSSNVRRVVNTTDCMVEALKGYRFNSIEIRLAQPGAQT